MPLMMSIDYESDRFKPLRGFTMSLIDYFNKRFNCVYDIFKHIFGQMLSN